MKSFSFGDSVIGADVDGVVRSWKVQNILPVYTSIGESGLRVTSTVVVLESEGKHLMVTRESILPPENGEGSHFELIA
jgi:hypothetical protein